MLSVLLAGVAAMAPQGRVVAPTAPSLHKPVPVATFDLDACIVAAASEDEVGQCMAMQDEFEPLAPAAQAVE
eukprot:2425426-Prymnesium_polylepis.1